MVYRGTLGRFSLLMLRWGINSFRIRYLYRLSGVCNVNADMHFIQKKESAICASFFGVRNLPAPSNFQEVPNRQKELLHCCDRMVLERKTEKMPTSQKDQLAAEVIDRWEDFQESLASVKRKYPIQQFQAYWSATKRYAELTKADALIHKRVAAAVHGLVDFLSAERKRVPSDVLRDAERLECLLFMEYDPCFEGDEPPGL